jgi:hypothetical protein
MWILITIKQPLCLNVTINNLPPEYLCSMFNSINENCPYGLKSATSNNLLVPVQNVNILKELFYTLAQIYGILSHPTLKV